MSIDLSKIPCQEASPRSGEIFIACGRPGAKVVFHQRDGRNVYVMCDACAYHNLKNRGGVELVEKDAPPSFCGVLSNYLVQSDVAELEMRVVMNLMEKAGMDVMSDEAIGTEAQYEKFKRLYEESQGASFMSRYGKGGET